MQESIGKIEEEIKKPVWLKIFIIFCWLNIVALFLFLGLEVVLQVVDPDLEVFLSSSLYLILELTPNFVFSLLIVRVIGSRNEDSIRKVRRLLGLSLVANFVVYLIIYFMHRLGVAADKPFPILLTVVYCCIWLTYFNKSRGVKRYFSASIE